MRYLPCFRLAWTVAALLGTAPAVAQDLRPDSLKYYGGTYSTNCADPTAPKVRIAANGLVVSHGARHVQTPTRMDSYTSFGDAPSSPVPTGYQVEFIGEDFSIYVFKDTKGLYVPLHDYVPPAEAVVGKAGMRARFGRCKM